MKDTGADLTDGSRYRNRMITVPNIICGIRLVGAIVLFGVAVLGHASVFGILFVILSLSDMIDGKLARWLNQRSDFGARLDSIADAVLYTALFFGLVWLRRELLTAEAGWWIGALLSYVLTTSAGVWKYGKIPSYHTYAAKASNWLVLIAAVCLFLDYSIWPFRIAMIAVTLTNIETAMITWYSKEWQADVVTVWHVFPDQQKSQE